MELRKSNRKALMIVEGIHRGWFSGDLVLKKSVSMMQQFVYGS